MPLLQQSIAVAVADVSQVGAARRAATTLASQLGMSDGDVARVAITATEAANNLYRHASGGEILLRACTCDQLVGMELIAVDRGPGMATVAACMVDGFSTGSTPGTGMGAIRRLSDEFDIFSAPGQGTALFSRIYPRTKPRRKERHAADVGVVCLPKPGQIVCGDSWAVTYTEHSSRYMIADGLGHGPDAAAASSEAVRVLQDRCQAATDPSQVLELIHGGLRSTRGAAVAIAQLPTSGNEARFAGIGNIGGRLLSSDSSRHLVSHDGIIGHRYHKLATFQYAYNPGDTLVLYSDGLASQWRMEVYPGLLARHPAIIAAILYRDHCRGNDDVTVLSARLQEG